RIRREGVEAQQVALRTESRDLPARDGSDHGVASKLLPTVYVRQVDLHDRQLDRGHRVAERDRVMRERAGGEDDACEPLALRGLEPVDQLALMIRLPALDRVAAATPVVAEHTIDLCERDLAVHGGLPGAEQVEVRPVQHEDLHDTRQLSTRG